jgi:hypothetical protein
MAYANKEEFFKKAKEAGVKIPALDNKPVLSAENGFWLFAYSLLFNADYLNISRFCKDYCLSMDDKQDLISIIWKVNSEMNKEKKYANSRTGIGRKQSKARS